MPEWIKDIYYKMKVYHYEDEDWAVKLLQKRINKQAHESKINA